MLDKILDVVVGAARFIVFAGALMYWWTDNTGAAIFCMLVLIWDILRDVSNGTNIEVRFKN